MTDIFLSAQEALSQAAVLIIGAGGLGCPAAIYLAACGVGQIGIVDHDSVEMSNLHRQILHTEASIGMHKAESAAAACRALNSSIKVALSPIWRPSLSHRIPYNCKELYNHIESGP